MLKLKNRRLELGLTQKELGEMVGKSKRYISDLETGHGQPGYEMIIKLCVVLDVSADWLMDIEKGA